MASQQLHIGASLASVVPRVHTQAWRTTATIVCSDAFSIAIAVGSSMGIWALFNNHFSSQLGSALVPLIALFLLCFAASGLYPCVAVSPTRELRDITVLVSLIYSALGTAVFLVHDAGTYSRAVFVLAWVQTLVLLPFSRTLARRSLARLKWWGYPTMILGGGEQGEMVVNLLQRNPELGFRPVLVLSNGTADKRDIRGVPVNDGFDLVERLGKDLGIRHAILAMPGLTRIELLDILKTHCQTLPHIFLIPDLSGVSSLWLQATDVAGVLAFQLQHRLLMPSALFVKRAIDLSLIAIGSIPVLPLVGFVALLVKVTSRGPIFYGHSRIGKGGVSFRAWKFRSMVVDSDRVLSNHLEEVPSARAEWEANQKLRHDPRVTWLGRILRKTSLDELPQLFNVFQGEMSLVGPRPIVEKEVVRYGDAMDLYQKVTPGITGLWQVSGRNNTSYAERVAWDEYYVRNWSAWLDFHILLRTVEVVLRREGAM